MSSVSFAVVAELRRDNVHRRPTAKHPNHPMVARILKWVRRKLQALHGCPVAIAHREAGEALSPEPSGGKMAYAQKVGQAHSATRPIRSRVWVLMPAARTSLVAGSTSARVTSSATDTSVPVPYSSANSAQRAGSGCVSTIRRTVSSSQD